MGDCPARPLGEAGSSRDCARIRSRLAIRASPLFVPEDGPGFSCHRLGCGVPLQAWLARLRMVSLSSRRQMQDLDQADDPGVLGGRVSRVSSSPSPACYVGQAVFQGQLGQGSSGPSPRDAAPSSRLTSRRGPCQRPAGTSSSSCFSRSILAGGGPSYCFFQLKWAARLPPARRPISTTGIPSAPCFRISDSGRPKISNPSSSSASPGPRETTRKTPTRSVLVLRAQIMS